MARIYEGGCHCGAISLALESAKSPAELGVRECDCSFCQGHGARTTSDNAGRATIRLAEAGRLNRYRFGLHTADILVCNNCGAYLGAYFDAEGGQGYATLNTRYFAAAGEFPAANRSHYQGETAEGRTQRRLGLWTPAVIEQN